MCVWVWMCKCVTPNYHQYRTLYLFIDVCMQTNMCLCILMRQKTLENNINFAAWFFGAQWTIFYVWFWLLAHIYINTHTHTMTMCCIQYCVIYLLLCPNHIFFFHRIPIVTETIWVCQKNAKKKKLKICKPERNDIPMHMFMVFVVCCNKSLVKKNFWIELFSQRKAKGLVRSILVHSKAFASISIHASSGFCS